MPTVIDTPVTPLGPRDAGVPLTLLEFESAEFEPGYRYELIHGVLVVTPPPLEEERDANEHLGHLLRVYRESHPEGGALDLTLPEYNVPTRTQNRRCDRAIWAGLGRMPRTRGPVARRDPPTVVVEFTSSRPADQRRDYEEKRAEYRQLGLREYWIVDRFRRVAVIHYWRGKQWLRKTIAEGEVWCSPFLPGFELNVAELLAVSDRYREPDAP